MAMATAMHDRPPGLWAVHCDIDTRQSGTFKVRWSQFSIIIDSPFYCVLGTQNCQLRKRSLGLFIAQIYALIAK